MSRRARIFIVAVALSWAIAVGGAIIIDRAAASTTTVHIAPAGYAINIRAGR